MARAHYRDHILDRWGNGLAGASVRVEEPATGELIAETLYAEGAGGATVGNPLTASATGEVEFYLDAPKRVQLRVSLPTFVVSTEVVEVLSPDVLAVPNAITEHLADPDPHPQYLTDAEGGAAFALVGHSHAGLEPGPHALSHATGGADPLAPEMIGAEATGTAILTLLAHEGANDHTLLHAHANAADLDAFVPADYAAAGHAHAMADLTALDAGDREITNLAEPGGSRHAATKGYVDRLTAGSGGSNPTDSVLVSGGAVVWESGFTYRVSAAEYYILGTRYNSLEQTVTLDAADATNPRIDVIALNNEGTVVKISGTPAANPTEPDLDPATQLQLSWVLVGAATSAPAGASAVSLYAENAGAPGEWGWATSGSGIVLNSATNPRAGTVCIRGTSMANGAYAQAEAAAPIDPNAFDQLVLFIRSAATWGAGRVLRLQWQSAGVKRGNTLTIASGYYGFDSSNVTDYQQVVIPMAQFAVPTGLTVNQLRIACAGGTISFGMDDVALKTHGVTEVVPGEHTHYVRGGPFFYKDGDLTVAAFNAVVTADQAGTLERFYCKVATAPTGAALTVDLKKNGSTIATCTVAADATSGTTSTFIDATVAVDDAFTIAVTQVGSTVAGASLSAKATVKCAATEA